MKFSIFFLALLASACGNYGPISSDADRVGDPLPVISEISTAERENIISICNSIADKELRLTEFLNENQSYQVSKKDCTGTEQVENNVQVSIKQDGSRYVLKMDNNVDFIFPNVETPNSGGILSSICSALPGLTSNPEVVSGSNILQFSTTGIDSSTCYPRGEEVCIRVLTANSSDRIVHTKEWLRVVIRPSSADLSKNGLVTERRKVTRAFCSLNEVITHRATLQ